MMCGLRNMCQYVRPSSPLPLCEMAILKITSRHICSHGERAAEMGGQRALQQLTVAYKVHFAVHLFHGQHFRHAATAYFPPADVNSFCLSASVCGPRMQLRVRRWKFWIAWFWTRWLVRVWGKKNKGLSRAIGESRVRHFWKPFFFFLEGSDMSKKSLNCLTYIRADREEPGLEPMETFICSPCCLLRGFTVISSCKFNGFNWARLLIKKNVSEGSFRLQVNIPVHWEAELYWNWTPEINHHMWSGVQIKFHTLC